MNLRAFSRFAFALLLVIASAATYAHKASDSYLTLEVNNANRHEVRGQWDIALRDLDVAIGIDGDGDGTLQWQEVKARHAEIARYALERLVLSSGGGACTLTVTDQMIDRHTDGAYGVLKLTGRCDHAIDTLKIDYRLLFDLDRQHRGLLKLVNDDSTTSAIFPADNATQEFRLHESATANTLYGFIADGVKHIAIGFDHILFLIALLLPAVLVRDANGWRPVTTLRSALINVASIVTAFTIAHSITLSAATLGLVTPPSRWIESLIAASVVLTAIDNVLPFLPRKRWLVAFAFGLIHGFGFAGVLQELDLPRVDLALSLIGFNIGVEIGQLVLVCALVPLAYTLRARNAYARVAVGGGSFVIAMVAGGWLLERSLLLEFMPFH